MEIITEMFSFPFVVRAFVVGILVAVCASALGVGLVLKRFSMLGDGLSHVGYGALAIGAVLNVGTPLYLSVPVVMIAAFFLLKLDTKKISGDAYIGMISAGALAVGTIAITLSTNSNADLTSYMFGSIYALTKTDMWLCVVLFAVVLVLFVLFYNKIFAITFDESFSRSAGISINTYNIAMAMLTAVTVVVGMTLMGALLISALVIFPPVTAMKSCSSFKKVVICSVVLGVVGLVAGLFGSYVLNTPPGATIVCAHIILYALFAVFVKARQIINKTKNFH